MAARNRVLQIGVAVVNFAIVALAFTSIWPFPSGDFKIDLPSANDVTWSYSGGVVDVAAPFSVDNGGWYDVQDLVISYEVRNHSLQVLTSDELDIGTLPAGHITNGWLNVTFDLAGFYNSGQTFMVFNDDQLYFDVHVSCYYTMKLIEFDASYNAIVIWTALIEDWGITAPTVVGPNSISVGFWLRTSSLLEGLPPALVTLQLMGNTSIVSEASTSVALGGNHTGTATFTGVPIDYLANPSYSPHAVRFNFVVAGFEWPAPPAQWETISLEGFL